MATQIDREKITKFRNLDDQRIKNCKWSCGGLNPGHFTCEANTLPLSYSPTTNSFLSQSKKMDLIFQKNLTDKIK